MNPWLDFLMTFGLMALLLAAAFGAGSWLEQGGKSDPEDYSDDD
jgi:hypothetical protein